MLNDDNRYVFTDYFAHTSREAVKNGAGVVALFFREVEKERQTHALLAMRDPLLMQAGTAGVRGLASFGRWGGGLVATVIRSVGAVGGYAANGVSGGIAYAVELVPGNAPAVVASNDGIQGQPLDTTNATAPQPSPRGGEGVNAPDPAVLAILQARVAQLSSLIAALTAARGEVAGVSVVLSSQSSDSSNNADTTPPQPSPTRGGGVVIYLAEQIPAQGSSTPTPTLPLSGGGGDAEATSTIEVDITPPEAPVFLTPEEGEILATTSVSVSGTAEVSSTVALSWLAGSATVVYETHADAGGLWSASLLFGEGTTTLGAVAIDTAGNVSSTSLRTFEIRTPTPTLPLEGGGGDALPPKPGELLLNEIAWSGTFADPADEWIEIYNATDRTLALASTSLEIGATVVPLSGTIGPRGYFVVAAREGALSPAPDLVADFGDGLDDAGEDVRLVFTDASAATVAIDELSPCANWCENGGEGVSVERFRADVADDDWSNWSANDGIFVNGTDRNGDAVGATPGARNSLSYLLALTQTLDASRYVAGETYILRGIFTVPESITLDLGPGTVLKWDTDSNARLVVRGTLNAQGTNDDPVVLTSIADDAYGGDTVGDGEAETVPVNSGIGTQGNAPSVFLEEAIMRYSAGIKMTKGTIALDDVRFENGFDAFGLRSGTVGTATDITLVDMMGGIDLDGLGTKLSLASTTMEHLTGRGIDMMNSAVIDASDVVMRDLNQTVGISLLSGARGTFNGLTIINTDAVAAMTLSGASATVTDAVITGGTQDGITLASFGGKPSTLALASSTVSDFTLTGIEVSNSIVTATATAIVDNAVGVSSTYSNIEIHDSVIARNTEYGIKNEIPNPPPNARPLVPPQIDGTANYWGDPAGPTLPADAAADPPVVKGDAVTIGVLVDPFLTEPPTPA